MGRACSVLLIAALVCASQVLFTSAADGAPFALRIACGSDSESYSPETGYLWSKDMNYTGGSSGNLTTVSRIASQLKTIRYFGMPDGSENCYNLSVPNGQYLIRMYFSFGFKDNSGREPEFEISMEGTLVYSLTRGWSTVVDNEYVDSLVHINDGAATICFHSSGHGSPVIASIEILQINDDAYNMGTPSSNFIMRTVKRVTAGAEKSGYGSSLQADPWGGDRYWATDTTLFTPGSSVNSLHTKYNISKFNNPPNIYPEAIYQSATTTGPENKLSYTIPVLPNQNYSIWLHFAEIEDSVTAPNERVFNVMANGLPLFQVVDIVKMAGGVRTALVLNKTVLVEGKTLTISLEPLAGEISINAFEVYQLIPREQPTSSDNVWALQSMKQGLELPSRVGWNGDPCIPQLHAWYGVNCEFDAAVGTWFITGLALDSQGLKGRIDDSIVNLQRLQSLNMSNNVLTGVIPESLGHVSSLVTLDLSYNRLNGSIPASLGQLPKLQELLLNDNQLVGEVPPALGAFPIRGGVLNLANNDGLCGVGLRSCNTMSHRQKSGIVIGVIIGFMVLILGGYLCWKRRMNMLRGAQRLPRDAPYAKARTTFVRDVQMARNTLANHFSRPSPYSESTPLNPH
ncbi:receptor-like protein 4 isoform X2 [Physcomitrium patens]|uniref:Malectin-like domain-containing protein n=1 Tax=Physcomitrium patens TaxID=3218 RepID=A0A2K1L4K8_PHYPA|nr:receptor like protein 4-like isoform X2 [Physcomitrium patens]PNR60947.1 hypothetical protein PHYPA_003740 [Physcomitrium patens]|eukprot:XP_024362217.1 receptor like protein 4-like isoform X2 [Physcomitrella patens]